MRHFNDPRSSLFGVATTSYSSQLCSSAGSAAVRLASRLSKVHAGSATGRRMNREGVGVARLSTHPIFHDEFQLAAAALAAAASMRMTSTRPCGQFQFRSAASVSAEGGRSTRKWRAAISPFAAARDSRHSTIGSRGPLASSVTVHSVSRRNHPEALNRATLASTPTMKLL
eukprot:Amastigsp_a679049_13.p3 type:complete len:171 gc:universal Amastigsp_a679049_13:1586-1074(-)